jgi:hypothetical protein
LSTSIRRGTLDDRRWQIDPSPKDRARTAWSELKFTAIYFGDSELELANTVAIAKPDNLASFFAFRQR